MGSPFKQSISSLVPISHNINVFDILILLLIEFVCDVYEID